MMATSPNGAVVRVSFKHTHFTTPKEGKKRGRAITLCYITLEAPNGALSTIAEGVSRCAWEDRHIFTKEEGRRRALKAATADLWETLPDIAGLACKAYFGRKR